MGLADRKRPQNRRESVVADVGPRSNLHSPAKTVAAIPEYVQTLVREALDGRSIASLERGGIIGSVEIVGCVQEVDSPWFTGPYGFVLANPKAVRFHPCKGALGFWKSPPGMLEEGVPVKGFRGMEA